MVVQCTIVWFATFLAYNHQIPFAMRFQSCQVKMPPDGQNILSLDPLTYEVHISA